MTTSIHPNSLAAHAATGSARAALESRIFALMADGVPRTDREVQRILEWPEPLRPRITELIGTGQLCEVGSTICRFTGKRVRLTRRFL